MIVRAVEYHTRTSEIILPLNDDIVSTWPRRRTACPPRRRRMPSSWPKGTMVQLKPGVWHPLPAAG